MHISGDFGRGAAPSVAPLPEQPPAEPAHAEGSQAHAKPAGAGTDQNALRYWARGPHGPLLSPPASNPDPAEGARRVLDAGRRWGTDDYDTRMVELAKELAKGDTAYREQLMAEIFKQDPGAMRSWLTPERANNMRYDGRISKDSQGMIAESLAACYNRGHVPGGEIGVGQDPKTGKDGRASFNELDQFIDVYRTGNTIDQVGDAQRLRQFLDFMDSADGPEAAQFRQKFAQHLIDDYVLNSAASFNDPQRRDAAAGLAANLLAGDVGNPQIAAEGLAKYDDGQLKSIMEAAARSNNLYSETVLKSAAGERQLDARDICVPDGAAALMLAVASKDSPEADQAAVKMSRLAASAPDVFEGIGAEDRVDALTLAVTNHDKAVLDALTDYDGKYIGTVDNVDLMQYMQNASDLGALFKLTLLDPKSSYSNLLQQKVVDYAGGLTKQINSPGPDDVQVGRMAMLQASLADGVRQGYQQLADQKEKQKEVLGFIVDLAVAGLPISKWTSSGIKSALAETFGNNARLQQALQVPLEQMFDKTTGKLTEQGKKAIVDALGAEEGSLEIAKNAANQLNESFMKQINPDDYDRKQIDTDYKLVWIGISTIRDKKK